MPNAADIIDALDLRPHPEGGWYRETWRADASNGARAAGTAIYYLLEEGQRSHWHRVDAAEIWHWYAGSPLMLSLSSDGKSAVSRRLGNDLSKGEHPQIIVASGWWQSAEPIKGWTLVGCTVSPGFEFDGFELAPPDWQPAS